MFLKISPNELAVSYDARFPKITSRPCRVLSLFLAIWPLHPEFIIFIWFNLLEYYQPALSGHLRISYNVAPTRDSSFWFGLIFLNTTSRHCRIISVFLAIWLPHPGFVILIGFNPLEHYQPPLPSSMHVFFTILHPNSSRFYRSQSPLILLTATAKSFPYVYDTAIPQTPHFDRSLSPRTSPAATARPYLPGGPPHGHYTAIFFRCHSAKVRVANRTHGLG
jgi:hypothetical protein